MGVMSSKSKMISSSNRNYKGRMGSPEARIFWPARPRSSPVRLKDVLPIRVSIYSAIIVSSSTTRARADRATRRDLVGDATDSAGRCTVRSAAA